MDQYSGSVIGIWIVLFLIIVAIGIGAFWWMVRTKNMKIESQSPSNDRPQEHEEFITRGASEVPPEITTRKP